MRALRFLPPVLLVLLAGCASTPADRIRREPERFAQFPAEVQERVRAGRIDIGDTEVMVRLALGEPERRIERRSADGGVVVWIYARPSRPRLSFGIGVGTSGRHSGVATSMGVSSGDGYFDSDDEAMRVEFAAGRVVRIETRKE